MIYNKLSDKGLFWNKKILEWESNRYNDQDAEGILEKLANVFNSALKNRMDFAYNILESKVDGAKVLEIGCGSGIFADKLFLDRKPEKYLGIDISPLAICEANRRFFAANDNVTFIHEDITSECYIKELDQEFDIVFSLGVLDWLTIDEIHSFFSKYSLNYADNLHSFSEKRFSLKQLFHSVYVNNKYGKDNGMYVPHYYTDVEMLSALNLGGRDVNFFRDKRMSFSTFIYNLG